jgi:hypothetical protein
VDLVKAKRSVESSNISANKAPVLAEAMESAETTKTFGSWTIAAWVLVAIFVVAILAFTRSSSTSVARDSLPTHELSVIQVHAIEDAHIKEADPSEPHAEVLVQPKKY